MPAPSMRQIAGGYQYVWAQDQLKATVTRFIDDRRGATTAEITIRSISEADAGHLHQSRINLLSTPGKKGLVSALRMSGTNGVEWDSIVETICTDALSRHREGEPIVQVGTRPFREGPMFRLDPLIAEGQPCLIFGEGGTFKSYLALLCAVLVQTGKSYLGLVPKQGNVLYVDYETSADEVNERLQAVARGLGQDVPLGIPYRFSCQPIDMDIDALQRAVNEWDISLVIVDSLGPAAGADPNAAESIIRMFAALRSLRTSCLLIDHVAKNTNTPTPFGSVYKTNLARAVWELRRSQTGDGIRVGLFRRKFNMGPTRKTLGFEIEFVNDALGRAQTVSIQRFNVKDDEDLSVGQSLAQRIQNVLNGGNFGAQEIAVRLGKPDNEVRARLNDLARMNPPKVVKLEDGSWGLAAITF